MNELELTLLLDRLTSYQMIKDKWWHKASRICKDSGYARANIKKDEVIIKEEDLKLLVKLVREDLFMLKDEFGE